MTVLDWGKVFQYCVVCNLIYLSVLISLIMKNVTMLNQRDFKLVCFLLLFWPFIFLPGSFAENRSQHAGSVWTCNAGDKQCQHNKDCVKSMSRISAGPETLVHAVRHIDIKFSIISQIQISAEHHKCQNFHSKVPDLQKNHQTPSQHQPPTGWLLPTCSFIQTAAISHREDGLYRPPHNNARNYIKKCSNRKLQLYKVTL